MGVSGSAGITIGRPSRVKRRRPSTVRPPSAPRRSRGAPYGVPTSETRPFPRRGGFFSRFPFTPSGFSAFSAALKARRSPFSTPASRYQSFTDARASSSAFGRCRSHRSQYAWSRIREFSFTSKSFSHHTGSGGVCRRVLPPVGSRSAWFGDRLRRGGCVG